jgi:hypothetical protein
VKYIFLTVAFTLATIASANADTTCAVNSPDGELNVRELTSNGPGRVIGVVKNGYTVTMRDFYLLKGKSWARVVDGKTQSRIVGWMYKDHLNCNIQATAPVRTAPTAPVRKSTDDIKRSGAWTTYAGTTYDGDKVLGMYTYTADKKGYYIKYFGDNYLVVQIIKDGWQFPNNDVDVPFSITINGKNYPADGLARMDNSGGKLTAVVEAKISDPELAGRFMADLMAADKMTITFGQGNERPWVLDTTGTRETGTAFNEAMKEMCSACGATQPFDAARPTQPYNKPTAKKNDRDI